MAPDRADPFRPRRARRDGVTARTSAHFTFGETRVLQLVFVNGRFAAELSALGARSRRAPGSTQPGCRAAKPTRADRAAPGARMPASTNEPFAALNTAFMTDGAFVYVPPGDGRSKQVVHLLFLSAPERTADRVASAQPDRRR